MELTDVSRSPKKEHSRGRPTQKPITIIDDYAHHPTEINATPTAARQAMPHRRVSLVSFSHIDSLDSVTIGKHLQTALSKLIRLLSVLYTPLEKSPLKDLMHPVFRRKSDQKATLVSLDEAHTVIANRLTADDIVITLGAGNVNTICTTLGDLING